MSAPAFDRRQRPIPGPPRLFRFFPFARHQALPGLELITAPDPKSHLLCLHLLVDAGGERETIPGLANLTAALVDEGTARHDALALAAKIESLGAALSVNIGWGVTTLTYLTRPEHLDAGLELLAEVVDQASFPAAEVERCRQQRLTELLRRRDSPAVAAELTLLGALYGEAPYGRSILGTEAALAALDRQQLLDFYDRRYRGTAKTLIAVGGFDPAQLHEVVATHWPRLATPSPPSEAAAELAQRLAPRIRRQRRVLVVDRPGAPQTELRIGQVGLERAHTDFRTLRLAAVVLGGKFTSRLNLNLRERHGFTYGVNAALGSRRGPAPFQIATAVANAVVGPAAAEIFHELERLCAEPVPADELAETTQYVVGTFPFTLQAVEDRAARLEDLVVFGLADDYFDRWAEELCAITPEELSSAVQSHLEPENFTLAAVGPAKELVPQLERWGEVEVLSAG